VLDEADAFAALRDQTQEMGKSRGRDLRLQRVEHDLPFLRQGGRAKELLLCGEEGFETCSHGQPWTCSRRADAGDDYASSTTLAI